MKLETEEKDKKVEQRLLKHRIILLYEEIDEYSASEIVQSLISLDTQNRKPIKLLINSPGGSVSSGLAIIDTMKAIGSQVHTYILSEVCSMAALVSICGDKRYITTNGTWMQHEMTGGSYDYISKAYDRAEYEVRIEDKMQEIMREHTKLTETELKVGTRGELWFNAKQCIEKGICDKIITKLCGTREKGGKK